MTDKTDTLVALADSWEKGMGAAHRRICAVQLREALAAPAEGGQGDVVDLGEVIREKVREHGSYRAASKAIGVNYPYLCQMAHDPNRKPSKEILAALGLERVTVTRRLIDSADGAKGSLARTKADTQWDEWSSVLRRLIADRTEKLHFAADVQADGDGVRFDNCRFIHAKPTGYVHMGSYVESSEATENMRVRWQPVWTSKPPATPQPAEGDGAAAFADWLEREIPPGTVISDPRWWAPKIARAYERSRPAATAQVPGLNAGAYFWLASVLTTYGDKLSASAMAIISERIAAPAAPKGGVVDCVSDGLIDRLFAESENYGLHEDVRSLLRDAAGEISELKDADAPKHGDDAGDGLRYVLCQVGFGEHYRDWLLIPHVDGQYVTAAKLQPFSMAILHHKLATTPTEQGDGS